MSFLCVLCWYSCYLMLSRSANKSGRRDLATWTILLNMVTAVSVDGRALCNRAPRLVHNRLGWSKVIPAWPDLDNNGKVDADEYRMGKISTTMFVDGGEYGNPECVRLF